MGLPGRFSALPQLRNRPLHCRLDMHCFLYALHTRISE